RQEQTMAISYDEALATLQSMFSDQGYTSQQLDAVLRHHGGHMEHTVETLLSHGEGTPDELMHKLPNIPGGGVAEANGAGGGDGYSHDIDADEELARQLAAEDERQQQKQQRGRRQGRGDTAQPSEGGGLGLASAMGANRHAAPPGQRRPMASTAARPSRKPAANKPGAAAAPKPPAGTKGRGTPTLLPADFLRIPGKKYPAAAAAAAPTATSSNGALSDPIASASGPGGMGQMMTDEQLARMLQDELFQEELRNNPEFSHLAGRRNPRLSAPGVGGSSRAGQATTGRSTYSGAGGGGVGWGERTDFFDRLSDLGDTAKRRFQNFAASWNDPNAQSNRQSRPLFGGVGVGGGGGGGAQSNTNNRGNERRGLLSNDLNMDEEEEEMDFVGGGNSGRDVEMNDVGGYDKKKD
ncbi:hypothetical protein ACHAXR_008080, partial [Thalassiosira sp. AJA248-18]